MNRRAKGTSLIELSAACLILVPLILVAFDGAYTFFQARALQELAEQATRLAANKATQSEARDAALKTVAKFQKGPNVHSVRIDNFIWNQNTKTCITSIVMEMSLPVTITGVPDTTLTAQSSQPILAIPAER